MSYLTNASADPLPTSVVRQRHVIEAHQGYHVCKRCGARRTVGYKPWAYGYGAWTLEGKEVKWCEAEPQEEKTK